MSFTPPAKKACLLSGSGSSGRGVKNEFLHGFYEASGPGRLRCKICYKMWLKKAVDHAVGQGTSEADAHFHSSKAPKHNPLQPAVARFLARLNFD